MTIKIITELALINDLPGQVNLIVEQIHHYQHQSQVFSEIIANIKNGTEQFYPAKALSEFKNNVDQVIPALLDDLRSRANNIVAEIRTTNPNYRPPVI